jgi:hypothetical protein
MNCITDLSRHHAGISIVKRARTIKTTKTTATIVSVIMATGVIIVTMIMIHHAVLVVAIDHGDYYNDCSGSSPQSFSTPRRRCEMEQFSSRAFLLIQQRNANKIL